MPNQKVVRSQVRQQPRSLGSYVKQIIVYVIGNLFSHGILSIFNIILGIISVVILKDSVGPRDANSNSMGQAMRQCPIVIVSVGLPLTTPYPPGDCYNYFPETGYDVVGGFYCYWQTHHGLEVLGFPISPAFTEYNEQTGLLYTVQYFERGKLEYHSESDPIIMVSLIGTYLLRQKYPEYPKGLHNLKANTSPGSILFPETGKYLGEDFLDYWQKHGGVTQFGYPLTNEFVERSNLDGAYYRVQYFQRAVFELHPTGDGKWVVMLAHIGRDQYRLKYSHVIEPRGTASQP